MSSLVPSIRTLSSVGFILSCYALYVEHKTSVAAAAPNDEEAEEFTALCDIEAIGASCSAVFQLPEGHLLSYFGLVSETSPLNVPNAALGAVYYFYMGLLLPLFSSQLSSSLVLIMTRGIATMAMSSSVFLAYKLTILQELCILCWTTHVLNSFLIYHAYFTLPQQQQDGKKKAS